MHFLAASDPESVPLGGYLVATRWILVDSRCVSRLKKQLLARVGRTFALHGRTWAPYTPIAFRLCVYCYEFWSTSVDVYWISMDFERILMDC